MVRSAWFWLFSVFGISCAAETPSAFYAYWGDGRAELSSYTIVQPRYGQLRRGHGVMIFVTEDLNRTTLIKTEADRTPQAERIYTLKLNNLLKFNTGIYDYAVMTSVFSAVGEGPTPFELLKITLTVQEWCGHVFDEIRSADSLLVGFVNSYFESEGRQAYELPRTAIFASEDHLLIRIRELAGPIMAEGDSATIDLLPSLWSFRLRQRPRRLFSTTLYKDGRQSLVIGDTSRQTMVWRWDAGLGEKIVWVDTTYPHRILRWTDSTGGSGDLLHSVRRSYWDLQDNADQVLRRELGIP